MCFQKEAAVERGLQREDSQMENVEDGNSPGKGRLDSGRGPGSKVHLRAISKVGWIGVGCLLRCDR